MQARLGLAWWKGLRNGFDGLLSTFLSIRFLLLLLLLSSLSLSSSTVKQNSLSLFIFILFYFLGERKNIPLVSFDQKGHPFGLELRPLLDLSLVVVGFWVGIKVKRERQRKWGIFVRLAFFFNRRDMGFFLYFVIILPCA